MRKFRPVCHYIREEISLKLWRWSADGLGMNADALIARLEDSLPAGLSPAAVDALLCLAEMYGDARADEAMARSQDGND
jgi:hypothetical protein